MNAIEQSIDVRAISPRLRHPMIFRTWDELPTDSAILLTNDHDPAPLYYQFAAEYAGHFHWEYLEQGPEVWQVRISKGHFENPGFVPKPQKTAPRAVPISFAEPLTLDTRPILHAARRPAVKSTKRWKA